MEDNIRQALANRLQYPLPGWAAQQRMASPMHRQARVKTPENTRRAGVLILLFQQEDHLVIPLIRRPVYPGVHSGQIAFPGGKAELQDQDIIDTALRETWEEIGVEVARPQVLGLLSDMYIPPSNITVSPVLAWTDRTPEYLPDPAEVADVIPITLADLRDPSKQKMTQVSRFDDSPLIAPAFFVQKEVIWGATAMMLSELLHIFSELD